MANSLYIHIPFCSHICSYCDFCKIIYNEQIADKYIECLIDEIESYQIKDKLKTIYLGGGTPSSLTETQLEKLLINLQKYVDKNTEFTVECNVENTTIGKLKLLKKYQVNRLSFGVQTFNDDELIKLNRHHTSEDVIKVINLTHEVGFNNINVDLIYGLPGIDDNQLEKDLDSFINLHVQHISTYSLMVEPNTVFYNKGIEEENDELSRKHYDVILAFLRKHGYERYEVSNFALPGFESKHNQVYWDNQEYYGCGLGAAGYLGHVRYKNTRSISEYLKGHYLLEKENVEHTDNINYFLLLKLRKQKGFKVDELKAITSNEEFNQLILKLNEFVKKDLLVYESDSYHCNDDGIMLLDMILRDLFL